MKPYRFFPHTADTKFQAYGKTLEEAFANAAYALTEVITDHAKIKKTTEKTIAVASESPEALLYDFLEKFLILLDTEGFLLREIKELKIEKNRLNAKLIGDIHPEGYEIRTHIKAITYQEMFIKKEKERFIIQVIPDI